MARFDRKMKKHAFDLRNLVWFIKYSRIEIFAPKYMYNVNEEQGTRAYFLLALIVDQSQDNGQGSRVP